MKEVDVKTVVQKTMEHIIGSKKKRGMKMNKNKCDFCKEEVEDVVNEPGGWYSYTLSDRVLSPKVMSLVSGVRVSQHEIICGVCDRCRHYLDSYSRLIKFIFRR